jgi:hypothetical protein
LNRAQHETSPSTCLRLVMHTLASCQTLIYKERIATSDFSRFPSLLSRSRSPTTTSKELPRLTRNNSICRHLRRQSNQTAGTDWGGSRISAAPPNSRDNELLAHSSGTWCFTKTVKGNGITQSHSHPQPPHLLHV